MRFRQGSDVPFEPAAQPVEDRQQSAVLDGLDSLSAEIIVLLEADRATARRTAVEFATSDTPELRHTGLWALGFVAEAQDIELLAAAATAVDATVRSTAIGSIPDPDGDDRAYRVILSALGDPDQQVRAAAVSRLGFTDRTDAVAPLASQHPGDGGDSFDEPVGQFVQCPATAGTGRVTSQWCRRWSVRQRSRPAPRLGRGDVGSDDLTGGGVDRLVDRAGVAPLAVDQSPPRCWWSTLSFSRFFSGRCFGQSACVAVVRPRFSAG